MVQVASFKAAVQRTGKYVREQPGDARSFSLDSPKSLVPRIEAIRKAERIETPDTQEGLDD